MVTSRDLMFGRMARYYDLLYAAKDYDAEVRRLVQLAQRFGRSKGRSWLDVACGTGRHLEFLRRSHAVVGVDRSREMLRLARRRLPGVALRRGDMRTFRLARRFDVVTCLFSAIGHLRSYPELRQAFTNFARHLRPGGLVMVEPWIDPTTFRPGHIHVASYTSPEEIVTRVAFSSRRGNRSLVHYHYLVAERDRGIRHLEEVDRGLLVSRADLLAAMRSAGLHPRFVPQGLSTGRGLLLGTKPL